MLPWQLSMLQSIFYFFCLSVHLVIEDICMLQDLSNVELCNSLPYYLSVQLAHLLSFALQKLGEVQKKCTSLSIFQETLQVLHVNSFMFLIVPKMMNFKHVAFLSQIWVQTEKGGLSMESLSLTNFFSPG